MTNRERYLLAFPHMAAMVETQSWAAKRADEWSGVAKPKQAICIHRGAQKTSGGCGGGCKVYECSVHQLCSTAPRAGIVQCRECPDFTPIAHESKS